MKKYRKILIILTIAMLSAPLNNIAAENKVKDVKFEDIVEEINEEEQTEGEHEESEPEENDEVEHGDIHMLLTKNSDVVPVGSIAQFQLYITSEGTKALYENVNIVVQLPTQINNETIKYEQNLEELTIQGVVPTYNAEDKTLKYHFDSLIGGFETSVPIKISTVNGAALNNTILEVEVSLEETNIEKKVVKDSVALSAASNISFTNILEGIIIDDLKIPKSSVRYEDVAVFGTGLSVMKLENGTLNLKAGSTVEFRYVLAEGFKYISNTSGVEPTVNGQVLSWTFDSQLNQDETYYFNVNFEIQAELVTPVVPFSKVINTAEASLTFTDDTQREEAAETKFLVTPNYEKDEAESFPDGAYATQFSSPSDSLGGSSGSQNNDIEVYPGALLGWNIYVSPLTMTTPDIKNNSYDLFVYPDANSKIVQFYSGKFFYRPNSAYKDAGILPLDEPVKYSLSVKYTDSDEWGRLIEEVTPEKMYTFDELGLDENREIEYLWMHFHDGEYLTFTDHLGYTGSGDEWQSIQPGITASNMRLYTTSNDGYIGKLENKFGVSFSGWRADGYLTQYDSINTPENLKATAPHGALPDGFEAFITNKTVRVVEPPEGPTRFVKANTYFSNSTKNMITTGDNKLNFVIGNDISSLEKLEGPFVAYALLDEGIEIINPETALGGSLSVVTTDFKNTGKTLVKLSFDKDMITINRQISMQVDVKLLDTMSYKTDIQLIGFLESDFEVAKSSNTNGTITISDLDKYDLNENNNFDEKVFSLKNEYTYKDAYEYAGMLLGHDDSIIINAVKSQSFETNITLLNNLSNPIKTLDLVYVLPTVEDTYVLGNSSRESEFNTLLKGPLKLEEKYEGLLEVYYSTSKEPELKDVLDANVGENKLKVPTDLVEEATTWLSEDEVSDFSAIRSIRIVKSSVTKSIKEDEINIPVSLNVDPNALEESNAYGTYAFAMNDASVLETQRVKVHLNADVIDKEYRVTGTDVVYSVEDAQSLQAASQLTQDILKKSDIKLYVDTQELETISDVKLTILDEITPIIEGEYTVLVEWMDSADTVGKTLASTTIKMTVVNPSAPGETVKPPQTGIANQSQMYLMMMLFASMLMLLAVSVKLKRNK